MIFTNSNYADDYEPTPPECEEMDNIDSGTMTTDIDETEHNLANIGLYDAYNFLGTDKAFIMTQHFAAHFNSNISFGDRIQKYILDGEIFNETELDDDPPVYGFELNGFKAVYIDDLIEVCNESYGPFVLLTLNLKEVLAILPDSFDKIDNAEELFKELLNLNDIQLIKVAVEMMDE